MTTETVAPAAPESGVPATPATGAPATPDLTTPAAGAPATPDPGTLLGGEAPAPVVPEKYELKLPESTMFDAAALEGIGAFAKDLGLSSEAAQKLVERDSKMLDNFAEHVETLAETEHKERVATWRQSVEKDPELGGEKFKETQFLADKAVRMFTTPELKQALNETGLGNHPELVRMFVKIGKAISEDSFTTKGTEQQASADVAQTMFPTMNQAVR